MSAPKTLSAKSMRNSLCRILLRMAVRIVSISLIVSSECYIVFSFVFGAVVNKVHDPWIHSFGSGTVIRYSIKTPENGSSHWY